MSSEDNIGAPRPCVVTQEVDFLKLADATEICRGQMFIPIALASGRRL